jgi:hypothetical protein
MFTFANVIHLLAHEFARLGGWRFSFLRVLARPLDRSLFRHTPSYSLKTSCMQRANFGDRQNAFVITQPKDPLQTRHTNTNAQSAKV